MSKWGQAPPSGTPPLVRDVGGASPPHEIRTPPPRFRGDPGSGASLRVWELGQVTAGRRTHTPGEAESYGDLAASPSDGQRDDEAAADGGRRGRPARPGAGRPRPVTQPVGGRPP